MTYSELFKDALEIEAQSILSAKKKIGEADVDGLVDIFNDIIAARGSLIFSGVGKSGHIATKLASTFSSLGLNSFFLHPNEALHGDLGRVHENDALVIISNSGTTDELLKLLPFVKIPQQRMIGLIGNPKSELARKCRVVFDCSVEKEACLNNLAPTTSTTTAMAVGDSMAVVFEKVVGLSKEGFAQNHPAGLLGKSLSLKINDIFIHKEQCAIVPPSSTMKDVILKMTEFPLGACAVIDEKNTFLGIIMEGDIRRTLVKNESLDKKVTDIMNSQPVSIKSDQLAMDAFNLMEKRERQISVLPIVEDGNFLGFIRLHDLFQAGFVAKNNLK